MEDDIFIPEKGKVLISEPYLADANFSRSVILLTEHNNEGSLGFVLNQPTDTYLHQLFEGIDPHSNIPIYKGGPVENETLHFIHSDEVLKDTAIEISDGLYYGGDFEAIMLQINLGIFNPNRYKFFVGYSGWGNFQLETEIAEQSWVVGQLPMADILKKGQEDQLWRACMRKLGGEFLILANAPINPQWN